ncbi:MAG: DUF58 domain-containing protein [Candidatus Moranbacteria bacterium]|nr:DUF58 domain-containing protein [Candidatus Moranbacteria bacterium]
MEKAEKKIPQKFANLELLARQVVEGFITGMHKSPFHGFSVEFAEHRIYNPGESTRHIDWKLFGRTEKLFVKKYEEETNLRCQIIIDNSSSMHFPSYRNNKLPSKIGFAVESAASLAYILRKQRDAVGLTVISDKTEIHTPARSSGTHHKLLISELEKLYSDNNIVTGKTTNAAKLLHEVAEKIHKRSLVVIFSDMIDNTSSKDGLFTALQHLKHAKHEVILFHVYEKNKELDFDFDSKPTKFIDMETGQELKLNPREIKEIYTKSVTEKFNEVRLKCMQYRIDFVEAEINKGYQQVLLNFFAKRKAMF